MNVHSNQTYNRIDLQETNELNNICEICDLCEMPNVCKMS